MVAVLLNAGDQLPVIPSSDVAGNVGAVAPLQRAGMEANEGVMIGLTVTVIKAVAKHDPEAGVKM